MSGTSLDGVDVAVLDTDMESVVAGPTYFRKYSKSEREIIARAVQLCGSANEVNLPEVKEAEKIVTQAHAEAIATFLEENELKAEDIDLVAFHGQTLHHAPADRVTIQVGEAKSLAKELDVSIVHDFRSADVAAGGEGAPLVPIFHKLLLEKANATLPAAIVNIGGVANVTILKDDGSMVAFDTGPGNALINDWIASRTSKSQDDWGRIAGEGTVKDILVNQWLSDEYFAKKPPKSLDRDAFSIDPLDRFSLADGSATLTAFSARSIALGLEPYNLKALYVTGGGAHNRTMMRMLEEACGLKPMPVDELGFDGDYLEAYAFAYLAARVEQGLPITFPQTTGVEEPLKGGEISNP